MGEDGGHGQAVRDAIEAAETMADAVDVTDAASGEAHAGVVGCLEHLLTGFDVGRVVIGDFEPFEDPYDRVFTQFVELLVVVPDVGVTLYRMGQSVETGGRGDFLRKAGGEFRIEDRNVRTDERVGDGELVVGLHVGDDRGDGGFGTGAGGGGDRIEFRREIAVEGHFRQRGDRDGNHENEGAKALDGTGRTANAGADTFRAVHGRTAADGDEGFTLVFFVKLQRGFDVLDARVRLDFVIDDIADAFCLQGLKQTLQQIEAHEDLLGNDEDLLFTIRFDLSGKLFDRSGALNDLRIREEPAPGIFGYREDGFDTTPCEFGGFPFVIFAHSDFLPLGI